MALHFFDQRGTDDHANTQYYSDAIMDAIASQITCLTILYSTIYSSADQRKHQSFASLALCNSPHKGPVTRKMFSFDDVIMSKRTNDVLSVNDSLTTFLGSVTVTPVADNVMHMTQGIPHANTINETLDKRLLSSAGFCNIKWYVCDKNKQIMQLWIRYNV